MSPRTEADQLEALELSSAIAYATRAATRQMEHIAERPVAFADLIAFGTDPQAWLASFRGVVSTVEEARKKERRLRTLIAEDATLPDHAWGAGNDSISVSAISEAVASAEAAVAPIIALEKVLAKPTRRAA